MNQVVVRAAKRGEVLVLHIHEIQSSVLSGVAFHILCEVKESGTQGSMIEVTR